VYDIIVATIHARTFRLYRKDRAPLAFLAWGLLDEKQEARFRAGAHLTAEELQSGDRAWIILAATPFVSAETVIQELRKSDFSNQPLMTII
jgi:hemolysin-activating ACP:hemolysin acyltransferase